MYNRRGDHSSSGRGRGNPQRGAFRQRRGQLAARDSAAYHYPRGRSKRGSNHGSNRGNVSDNDWHRVSRRRPDNANRNGGDETCRYWVAELRQSAIILARSEDEHSFPWFLKVESDAIVETEAGTTTKAEIRRTLEVASVVSVRKRDIRGSHNDIEVSSFNHTIYVGVTVARMQVLQPPDTFSTPALCLETCKKNAARKQQEDDDQGDQPSSESKSFRAVVFDPTNGTSAYLEGMSEVCFAGARLPQLGDFVNLTTVQLPVGIYNALGAVLPPTFPEKSAWHHPQGSGFTWKNDLDKVAKQTKTMTFIPSFISPCTSLEFTKPLPTDNNTLDTRYEEHLKTLVGLPGFDAAYERLQARFVTQYVKIEWMQPVATKEKIENEACDAFEDYEADECHLRVTYIPAQKEGKLKRFKLAARFFSVGSTIHIQARLRASAIQFGPDGKDITKYRETRFPATILKTEGNAEEFSWTMELVMNPESFPTPPRQDDFPEGGTLHPLVSSQIASHVARLYQKGLFPQKEPPKVLLDAVSNNITTALTVTTDQNPNEGQHAAVQSVINHPITAMDAPAGTGKTFTLVCAIEQLLLQPAHKLIVVTAASNHAVANVARACETQIKDFAEIAKPLALPSNAAAGISSPHYQGSLRDWVFAARLQQLARELELAEEGDEAIPGANSLEEAAEELGAVLRNRSLGTTRDVQEAALEVTLQLLQPRVVFLTLHRLATLTELLKDDATALLVDEAGQASEALALFALDQMRNISNQSLGYVLNCNLS